MVPRNTNLKIPFSNGPKLTKKTEKRRKKFRRKKTFSDIVLKIL